MNAFQDTKTQASLHATRQSVMTRLFNEHHRRLQLFVYARIHHSDDAADLTAQVFAEACRVFDTFRGGSEVHTWLYAIAMNLIRNYLSRSPRRRFEFCDDEVLAELPATDADACTDVEQKEVLSRLQCHLDTLPEHLKSPLLMVAIDEMSYDEVASQLDIPIGTVRSRISRSRSMLRERFHEEGIPLARQSVV